ncbi:hypothetical protein K456DRAFT_59736 [Colletotrichum gloeosporioides 23]|nr:hypothetical protein K456DRAFT_59736 [Colletotrichum gloeosporioides 23]
MVTPSAPQAGNSANSYRDQQDSILQVLLACYVLLLLCRFHPRLSSTIEPANRQRQQQNAHRAGGHSRDTAARFRALSSRLRQDPGPAPFSRTDTT